LANLYVIIPKGFFPQQDTGLIIAQSEAAQDISFQAMRERQQALLDAVVRDRPLSPWARLWVRAAGSTPSMTAACSFSSSPMVSGRRSGR